MPEPKHPLKVFPSAGSGQASVTPIAFPCGTRTVNLSARCMGVLPHLPWRAVPGQTAWVHGLTKHDLFRDLKGHYNNAIV